MNYLRPDIKRGNITPDEEDLIIRLHSLLGNRWSLIAKRLPGRTDNEIKNYWNSHLSKRVKKSETNSKEASSRSSRKAKKSTTKKKQENSKDNQELKGTAAIPTPTTAKVHQPKATRVSPFSVITRCSSFDSVISGSSSSSGEGGRSGSANNDSEFFGFPPYNLSGITAGATYSAKALVSDEDQQFPHGFDPAAFLDAAPEAESNMLDDIFEEYQQLLETDHPDPDQTDSFFDYLMM